VFCFAEAAAALMAAVEAELAVIVSLVIGATDMLGQMQLPPMERLTWGSLGERSALLPSSDDLWGQPLYLQWCRPLMF
jgi:hypothetical protein